MPMRNLLVKIAYNGAAYHGWQVQKNALTVQEVVQDAVEKLFGRREDVVGCSRTDTGVHANEYFFNMHTEKGIPCRSVMRGMNTLLPDDVAVLGCTEVEEDFHARYCCTGKEYIYKIWNAESRNPFLHRQCLRYPFPLDIHHLNRAMERFLGTHDFSAFCSAGSDVEDRVRTITQAHASREGDLVTLTVRGDGFLYNMVRILVGTLIEVQEGKLSPDDIPSVIASRDRSRAGKTAPPCGLFLNRVFYQSLN